MGLVDWEFAESSKQQYVEKTLHANVCYIHDCVCLGAIIPVLG